MGEMVDFSRPDGQLAPGYLASSSDPQAAGIVVIQEWWGLNPQIKGVADRLTLEGYHALVPDLYRGKLTTSVDEANHLMTGLDWMDACGQDIRGAVQYLKATGSSKVGVLGFCMGGALTILAGVHLSEVDTAICYYGVPPEAAADPSQMRVPFQGHFATQDDWVNPTVVETLDQSLKKGDVVYEIYSYEAQHAFFNETRPKVYSASASELAWHRSLKFLAAHLR